MLGDGSFALKQLHSRDERVWTERLIIQISFSSCGAQGVQVRVKIPLPLDHACKTYRLIVIHALRMIGEETVREPSQSLKPLQFLLLKTD